MHRFFIDPEDISGEYFIIDDPKVIKYMRNVLRLNPNDKIGLFDGAGSEYTAIINKLTKSEVTGQITSEQEVEEKWPRLILAQALPKGNKLDDVVRMNTEVGVESFLLFESDHSIVKISDFRENKLDRLTRIMVDATRQSGRSNMPTIDPPMPFADVLQEEADLKLIMHTKEGADTIDINDAKSKLNKDSSVLVLVGPEGGFSDREVEMAIDNEFTPVHLNLPVMRTETAGLVASAVLLS